MSPLNPLQKATDRTRELERERGIEDPVVAAILSAEVGEVELTEKGDAIVATVRARGAGDVARIVSVVSRAGGRVAVSRRLAPGLVSVDLSNLDAIDPPDEVSCLVRVGAGATVRDVEARAIQSGLTLGPLLPSSQNKKVGAWLSGPTRGERAVPSGRLESAALSLEAVLADGSFYRSREVPRSATGPDLDHLLLGGEGRFGIVTRATLRLFPRALVEAAGAREAVSLVDAVEMVRNAMRSGLSPVEARWNRARRTVEARFTGSHAARRARAFGEVPLGGHEIRGHLELAGSWGAWTSASPLKAEALQFVAIHSDGAFGVVEFADAADADRAAAHARAIGFSVVSPRRLRPPPGTPWAGASAAFARLVSAVDASDVFASVPRQP